MILSLILFGIDPEQILSPAETFPFQDPRSLIYGSRGLWLSNGLSALLSSPYPDDLTEIEDEDLAIADLAGTPPVRRAFVIAQVARDELPPVQKLNLDDAARYL